MLINVARCGPGSRSVAIHIIIHFSQCLIIKIMIWYFPSLRFPYNTQTHQNIRLFMSLKRLEHGNLFSYETLHIISRIYIAKVNILSFDTSNLIYTRKANHSNLSFSVQKFSHANNCCIPHSSEWMLSTNVSQTKLTQYLQ